MDAKERRIIVVVDDSSFHLAECEMHLKNRYAVYTAGSAETMFRMLDRIKPDLILLDVMMPGMDGYEVIKVLKSNKETAGIPVIFLTADSDPESEAFGLSLGAADYIRKPYDARVLVQRIETQLRMASHEKGLAAAGASIGRSLAAAEAAAAKICAIGPGGGANE